jgi:hypothetical protein
MDASIILFIFLLIILTIALILLASILSNEHFIISVERHTPNYEQTKIQPKPKSIVGRIFRPSPKPKPPTAVVKGFRILNFTFKFADYQKDPGEIPAINEASPTLIPVTYITEAEWEAEQKRQEEKQKQREKIHTIRENIQAKYP